MKKVLLFTVYQLCKILRVLGHINIKERISVPDVEMLAVGLRSYYCPGSSHTPSL